MLYSGRSHAAAEREILAGVAAHTSCKILLAQKAFSDYGLYPVLAPYLAGTEASGLYEARLGAEEMPGKEVHVFCGAYHAEEFEELLQYADHIVFNSPRQLERFGPIAREAEKSIGLCINPERSTQGGTPSTPPAPLEAVWGPPAPSGIQACPRIWPGCWTDRISIRCAGRTPMPWTPRCKWWRGVLAASYPE